MEDVQVRHLEGDRFEITVRQHTLMVDQPVGDGGRDTAPTPTEMFLAALASCVAYYARRFLERHDLCAEGLSVAAAYEMGTRPPRVADVRLRITVPAGLPEDRRAALLAVASHCTVHNTLRQPPAVRIELADQARSAA